MRVPIAVAAAALLSACSDRAPPPEPPRTQPLAQDGTIARAVTSLPDRTRVQLDLAAARAALRTYRAERGAWPEALGELRLEGLAYPGDLAYDAASGTVASRTYPGL